MRIAIGSDDANQMNYDANVLPDDLSPKTLQTSKFFLCKLLSTSYFHVSSAKIWIELLNLWVAWGFL